MSILLPLASAQTIDEMILDAFETPEQAEALFELRR